MTGQTGAGSTGPTGATGPALYADVVTFGMGNLTLSNATTTVDGYTLVTGDIVLAIEQTDHLERGLWVASTTGAWSRAVTLASMADKLVTTSSKGTSYGNTLWYCNVTFNLGTPQYCYTYMIAKRKHKISTPYRWYYEAAPATTTKQPFYYIETDSTLRAIRWYRDDSTTVVGTTVFLLKLNGTTLYTLTLETAAASGSWATSWNGTSRSGLSDALYTDDYLSIEISTGNTTVKNFTIQLDIDQTVTLTDL